MLRFYTVAACFFALGFATSAVLSRNSPVFAFQNNTQMSDEGRPIYRNVGARGFRNGTGLLIDGVVPTYIPLTKTPILEGYSVSSGGQQLDGMDCRECTFTDASLSYGGGAFNLSGAKFSGTTTVKLEGAAANTAAFLDFMRRIGLGVEGVSFPPYKPIERKAVSKKPMTTMSVTAPYIGPGQ